MELATAIVDQITSMAIVYIAIGTFLGIIVGAIPGLTATMLISLSLPLTFFMSSDLALALLLGMYVGGVTGGLVTATLLNIPGTPASIVTTFDGFPMARRGEAGLALGWGIVASFVGSVISWAFLVTLSKPLADFAIRFTSFDYFGLVLISMFVIAAVSTGNMLKGILAGFLGMLVSLPGIDPIGGNYRFLFGVQELENGFRLMPVLVGLFAGSQVLSHLLSPDEADRNGSSKPYSIGRIMPPMPDIMQQMPNMARSSLIGTVVGILPGIGSNIGSMLAYTAARVVSKTPEKFGTGHRDGIVASEAGNNATVGGALIPLVAMGIPGSVVDAVLMGAMAIHDVHPGPFLFRSNPGLIYGMMSAVLIASFFMLLMMLVMTKHIVKVVNIPKHYLMAGIMTFCVAGSFALNNSWWDVWVMLIFSVVGYVLDRTGFSLAAFIIGLILAPLAEEKLRVALQITNGGILPLFTQNPIGAGLVALTALVSLAMLFNARRAASRRKS